MLEVILYFVNIITMIHYNVDDHCNIIISDKGPLGRWHIYNLMCEIFRRAFLPNNQELKQFSMYFK